MYKQLSLLCVSHFVGGQLPVPSPYPSDHHPAGRPRQRDPALQERMREALKRAEQQKKMHDNMRVFKHGYGWPGVHTARPLQIQQHGPGVKNVHSLAADGWAPDVAKRLRFQADEDGVVNSKPTSLF